MAKLPQGRRRRQRAARSVLLFATGVACVVAGLRLRDQLRGFAPGHALAPQAAEHETLLLSFSGRVAPPREAVLADQLPGLALAHSLDARPLGIVKDVVKDVDLLLRRAV